MGKNQISMVVIGNLLPMLPSTYSFRGRLQRSSYKSSSTYEGRQTQSITRFETNFYRKYHTVLRVFCYRAAVCQEDALTAFSASLA